MIKSLGALLILSASLCLSSAAQAQLPPWTRFKLDNGLEVLVVENHLTPIVTVEIAVKNGSFTEPPEFNGLSHLYEHMFFTANARDTTEDEFLGKVDDLGILYNGETQEENVQYYFTLPKQNLDSGLSFMATAIENPLFKESELHKQREIVLAEFDRNEALPLFNLGRKVDAALWGDLLSRKEKLGFRPTIQAATREQMLTIKNKYYIPNNSLLIVAGDVKTDEIRDLVPKYFNGWQRGPDPFIKNPPPVIPSLKESVIVTDTVDQPTATVMVRWHGPSIGIDDKSTYAADVFSYIIGQSEHEFTRNLQESGLALGTNFWYYTQRYVGPIQADIITTSDKLTAAMQMFWSEVAKFDDPNYFTDEELETSKHALRIQTLYRSESLSTFVQDLAFWWASTGLDYYEHYLDNLSKINREDIKNYVHRYIQRQPYVMGIGLSKESLDKIHLDVKTVTEPSDRP
jgi:zinc protease